MRAKGFFLEQIQNGVSIWYSMSLSHVFQYFPHPCCVSQDKCSCLCRGSGGEWHAKLEYNWQISVNRHDFFILESLHWFIPWDGFFLPLCIAKKLYRNFPFVQLCQHCFLSAEWLTAYLDSLCMEAHSSMNKLALVLAWHHLYYVFLVTDNKQDRPKETTCVSSFQQHFDSMLCTLSTIFSLWPHSSSDKAI